MMPRHGRHAAKSNGQISVMMVLSLIPLFTLFAFVVNVGMLVNAKIALQNAADLAAYAGAATQARQMTAISHLNYQMRQAYKKFLFRYYVLGNIGLKCFPRGGATPPECAPVIGGPEMKWINVDRTASSKGASTIGTFPGMPIVCLHVSADTNVCQMANNIPFFEAPSGNPFDPTQAIMQKMYETFKTVAKNSCEQSSVWNVTILTQWLYGNKSMDVMLPGTNIRALVNDIGLVTEEILLKNRIGNVAAYVNAPPREVDEAALRSLMKTPDEGMIERTAMAFRTAQGNLNSRVFTGNLRMKELLPPGGGLKLTPIQTAIDTGAAHLAVEKGNNQGCNLQVEIIPAKPFVGVYKEPSSYVYYAVKLTAPAQILFNPFPFGAAANEVELTAYAAAAPFGSRIGPKLDASDFHLRTELKGQNARVVNVPWLRLQDDQKGLNWNTRSVLEKYSALLHSDAQGQPQNGSVGADGIYRGVIAATLPEEFEIGKYNIPVDIETTPATKGMVSYFNPAAGGGGVASYSVWAPVRPVGDTARFLDEYKLALEDAGGDFVQSNSGSASPLAQERGRIRKSLEANADELLQDLNNTQTLNVARLPDPFGSLTMSPERSQVLEGKVLDKTRLATSYTTDHDSGYFQIGRVGYSVKLVPFNMLISKGGAGGNDGGQIRWAPVKLAVPEFADLLRIHH